MNPDNIIPPDSELGQRLAQWAEDTDTRTWHIANVTNELIDEIVVEGGEITRSDIYKAVGARCKGQKPNTIRRIADVARDFDLDTQEQYAQLLSFSHFRTARRLYQEGKTPYIEYALEWCVQGNDDKLSAGRFHTVGEMLQHFLPADTFENQLRKYWDKTKEKLYDLILIHDNDIERVEMLAAWNVIDSTVGLLTERLSDGTLKK